MRIHLWSATPDMSTIPAAYAIAVVVLRDVLVPTWNRTRRNGTLISVILAPKCGGKLGGISPCSTASSRHCGGSCASIMASR